MVSSPVCRAHFATFSIVNTKTPAILCHSFRFCAFTKIRPTYYCLISDWISILLLQVFCGKANEKQLSVESLQSYIDVMVRQIRDSHEKKEEALENRLRELKVTIRDMVQKHESLSSAYRYIQFNTRTAILLFSFECRKVTGYVSPTLHDWIKKMAPFFRPIRSKPKTSSDLHSHTRFPAPSATCNPFEFWLVHWVFCLLSDWLEW